MPPDPLLGRTLGDFEIELLLGKGGMGSVYRAEQKKLGRKVALKVLSAEYTGNEEFRKRFLAESHTAASIDHPNILPVYDAGEEGDLLYIALRLVEGSEIDLQALLEREGALVPERALAVVAQVASALDAAHAAGLVHRDVKPGNILLAGDHVYLTDFGIAKLSSGRRELTRTGGFVGTLDYASPEQIRNDPVDGASDIYSLGAVLYHCLTGHVPFDRPSEYGVMKAHLEEPAPSVAASAQLPPTLDAVFATAMAKEPDERYRSGRHLVEAAMAALAGETVPGPAPTIRPTVIDRPIVAPTMVGARPLPAEKGSRSRGGLVFTAALAGVLIVSVVVVLRPGTGKPLRVVAAVPMGANLTTMLVDPQTGADLAQITFESVVNAGQVTLGTTDSAPPLPKDVSLLGSYYDVSTTAGFRGHAQLCFIDGRSDLAFRIYHYSGSWSDVTTRVTPPLICGDVTSLSPFAVVRTKVALPSESAGSSGASTQPSASTGAGPTTGPTPASPDVPLPTSPTSATRTSPPVIPSDARTQQPSFTVNGTVVDSVFGVPVPAAIVVAYGSNGTSVAASTTTDASGAFSLSLAPGGYRLRLSSGTGSFAAQDWNGMLAVDGDRSGLVVRVLWPSSNPRENARPGGQGPYWTVTPTSTVQIWYTVINSGSSTWRAGGLDGYVYRGLFQWQGRTWPVCCNVAPGQSDNFVVTQVVPSSPGLYRYGMTLSHNGIDFGPVFFTDVTVRTQNWVP